MTAGEKKILRILLRALFVPVDLSIEQVGKLTETALYDRMYGRSFWDRRRILLTHMTLGLMREGDCPKVMITAWYQPLLEYFDTKWTLKHPLTNRKVRIEREFAAFKERYDLQSVAR